MSEIAPAAADDRLRGEQGRRGAERAGLHAHLRPAGDRDPPVQLLRAARARRGHQRRGDPEVRLPDQRRRAAGDLRRRHPDPRLHLGRGDCRGNRRGRSPRRAGRRGGRTSPTGPGSASREVCELLLEIMDAEHLAAGVRGRAAGRRAAPLRGHEPRPTRRWASAPRSRSARASSATSPGPARQAEIGAAPRAAAGAQLVAMATRGIDIAAGRRIAVLGADGFIGSALVRQALGAGATVPPSAPRHPGGCAASRATRGSRSTTWAAGGSGEGSSRSTRLIADADAVALLAYQPPPDRLAAAPPRARGQRRRRRRDRGDRRPGGGAARLHQLGRRLRRMARASR